MQIRIVDLFLFDDTEQGRRHLSRVNDQSFGRLGSSTATKTSMVGNFRGRLTNTTTSASYGLTQNKETAHQKLSRDREHLSMIPELVLKADCRF